MMQGLLQLQPDEIGPGDPEVIAFAALTKRDMAEHLVRAVDAEQAAMSNPESPYHDNIRPCQTLRPESSSSSSVCYCSQVESYYQGMLASGSIQRPAWDLQHTTHSSSTPNASNTKTPQAGRSAEHPRAAQFGTAFTAFGTLGALLEQDEGALEATIEALPNTTSHQPELPASPFVAAVTAPAGSSGCLGGLGRLAQAGPRTGSSMGRGSGSGGGVGVGRPPDGGMSAGEGRGAMGQYEDNDLRRYVSCPIPLPPFAATL